ncbi:unnamed protein product [Zymoseptoria tritici ST99CH_1A5]|uniref:BTB domain-containing protein n=2 Tax=Zymoseptoria tritici TaxID=1047171 RepID=A0A1X7S673_ZYMT9|nr:unnamed protein product [Zymoseptoria tritici ST99CH_3D7]SMY28850.1 unnamed protein product [Zymoseptoria tritici ST99CH_1A5]
MVDMEELIDNLLKKPRLISISIGGSSDAVQVQQQFLQNLSPYFANALKHDRFKEGREGVLNFPEDDMDVWKTLLHWIFCRELPDFLVPESNKLTKDNLLLAVRCWTTGDKYGIASFQDTIILRILRHLDAMQDEELGKILEVEVVLTAFERTVSGSILREIFTDYMVSTMYGIGSGKADAPRQPSDSTLMSLDVLDGTGFFPAMTAKRTLFDRRGSGGFKWWNHPSRKNDDPRWLKCFLAYDGFKFKC